MPSTDQLSSVESDRIGRPSPIVVLDTNVVMDWLVFEDPGAMAWVAAIQQRSVRWLAVESMRDELAHVLSRGIGASRQPDMTVVWEAWAAHCEFVLPANLCGPASRIRCTDPDDQKFVDLALGCGARWLVSRDRAVLKLTKRTRPLGLAILTPEQWVKELSQPD